LFKIWPKPKIVQNSDKNPKSDGLVGPKMAEGEECQDMVGRVFKRFVFVLKSLFPKHLPKKRPTKVNPKLNQSPKQRKSEENKSNLNKSDRYFDRI